MNRTDAARAGAMFYDARPCKHDGDTRRYVLSGCCVTCSKRRGAAQAKAIRALVLAGRAAKAD